MPSIAEWNGWARSHPDAKYYTVDRSGMQTLWASDQIIYVPQAGRWLPTDQSVVSWPLGLLPVSGDFKPEDSREARPDIALREAGEDPAVRGQQIIPEVAELIGIPPSDG